MEYNQQMMITTIITMLQTAVRKAMAKEDPDDVLFSFIDSIGRFLGAKSAFLFDDMPLHFYCWTDQGMKYDNQRVIQKEVRHILRTWMKTVAQKGEPVVIPDVDVCPDLVPSMRQSMDEAHIHNLALIGISMPGNRIGAISLENIPPENLEQAGELLRLGSSFLLMMLKNRGHIYQLRHHSFIDQMTGVFNRNAFNAYQQHLACQGSMGVLFADINNLKQINDEQGHASGDRLICHTASVLFKYRHGGEVFRIGGDEFVVIWKHIEELDFQQACRQIRKHLYLQDLNISLGNHWVPDVKDGIAPVMKIADHHMYEEKRRYHKMQVSR